MNPASDDEDSRCSISVEATLNSLDFLLPVLLAQGPTSFDPIERLQCGSPLLTSSFKLLAHPRAHTPPQTCPPAIFLEFPELPLPLLSFLSSLHFFSR